jgi:hypothetical protein
VDLARAAVRLPDRRIDDILHHRRDVDSDSVALDERDDGVVGRRLSRNELLAALGHADRSRRAHPERNATAAGSVRPPMQSVRTRATIERNGRR